MAATMQILSFFFTSICDMYMTAVHQSHHPQKINGSISLYYPVTTCALTRVGMLPGGYHMIHTK